MAVRLVRFTDLNDTPASEATDDCISRDSSARSIGFVSIATSHAARRLAVGTNIDAAH